MNATGTGTTATDSNPQAVRRNVTTACGKNHRWLSRSGSTRRPSTTSWSNQARTTSLVLAVTMIRSKGAPAAQPWRPSAVATWTG
jgi:hypothetical protein